MNDTHLPTKAGSVPNGYSYDSLLENRAGNFHRHTRRSRRFPL
jgi:hypothetical protein